MKRRAPTFEVSKAPLTPVLVVDDQRTTLDAVSKVLESLGIQEVETASDGAEAWSMLQERCYNLVISDWHMPSVSGLQLLQEMRNDDRFAETPFIMITGDAQVDLVLSARQAGADALILKPFDMRALRTKICDVVKRKPAYASPAMAQSRIGSGCLVAP